MKRILIVILFLAAASRLAADPPGEDVHRPHADDNKWYLQFDLGINWSFLNGNPVYRQLNSSEAQTDLFKSAAGIAPIVSATIGHHFSNLFALSLGLAYDGRHAGNSATTLDTVLLHDSLGNTSLGRIPIGKNYTVDATYLSVTLLGNFCFDRLYLFIGPTVSVPLTHSTFESENLSDTSRFSFLYPSADTAKSASGTLNANANLAGRISLKLGAGYLFPITTKISLVPQLAYDIGFSDLLLNDELNTLATPAGVAVPPSSIVNHALRLNSLQATIGLRINL